MDIQADYSFRAVGAILPDGESGKAGRPVPQLRDRHLVLAAQAGSRTAFEQLWALYSGRVYRTVSNITRNSHDAEDALQDAFFRAYLAIGRFESRANFYTWLTRIAINSALGILRKRRSRPEASLFSNSSDDGEAVEEDFKDAGPSPEFLYGEEEKREKLMLAIERLPSQLRTITHALIREDYSVKDVACRLNISVPAAKARLYRARIKLRSLTAAPHSEIRRRT
jgi:RNA polymerase sigma-70 factor (ECF subfamily)